MQNNKMPKVGERYRNPRTKGEWILEAINPFNSGRTYHLKENSGEDFFHHITADASFFDYYEEIPDNSQESSEVQVKESILSDEVREAMEKLKKELYSYEAMVKSDIPEKNNLEWGRKLLSRVIEQNKIDVVYIEDQGQFPSLKFFVKDKENYDKVMMYIYTICPGMYWGGVEIIEQKGDCGIVEDARKCNKCGYQYSFDDKIYADEAHICINNQPEEEKESEEERLVYSVDIGREEGSELAKDSLESLSETK